VAAELADLWTTRADYSHGLLVVPFAGYLLWSGRGHFTTGGRWPDPWGLPFVLAAAGLYLFADRTNYAKEGSQAFALVLALAGVAVMFCGRWAGLRWAGPGLAFLVLAFPLPHGVEQTLSFRLRSVATEGANFAFQTLGLASYTEGNVIAVGETRLEVENACSGLSMLLVFVAVAAAIALLCRSRPLFDRGLVLASGVPVAVACNVARITATGLVYHAGWTDLGDAVVHDLAGWLMMPVALGLIWAELRLVDWVTEPAERVGAGEVLRLPGVAP
jgi:exosortase